MVYTPVLGTGSARTEGSSPSPGTHMQKSEAKIFAAELGAEMPELDLHDKYPHEIEDEVRGFVLEKYNQDVEMIKIIYGGGTGKMKETVLDILKQKELKAIILEIKATEGNCIVVFKD